MNPYVILLRGINVGGKNIIPMAELRNRLADDGFSDVTTYIASGNVVLRSDLPAAEVKTRIEELLAKNFNLDDGFVKVLVLKPEQLQAVIDHKPQGFGEEPEKYHSDVFFLMELDAQEVMPVFKPREGVDKLWPGIRVIYSQRLSALLSKSGINKIIGTAAYKNMTVRNWNTTTKLLELVNQSQREEEGT